MDRGYKRGQIWKLLRWMDSICLRKEIVLRSDTDLQGSQTFPFPNNLYLMSNNFTFSDFIFLGGAGRIIIQMVVTDEQTLDCDVGDQKKLKLSIRARSVNMILVWGKNMKEMVSRKKENGLP